MKRWLVILLVVLALGAAAFFAFPAVLAQRFLAGNQNLVQLENISGSIWDGKAQNLVVLGQALGAVNWQMSRASVLQFKPAGDLAIDGQFVQARAQFLQQSNLTQLDNVKANFPANLLGPALDIPALLLMGKVDLDLPQVQLESGFPTTVLGRVEWRDLETGGAAALRLPGIRIDFAPVRDATTQAVKSTGVVSDLGGPLAVNGVVTLNRDQYRAEVNLRARELNSQLQTALKYVGQAQADGSSLLIIEGKVKSIR